MLKANRVRADTTVIEANVAYPIGLVVAGQRRGTDRQGGPRPPDGKVGARTPVIDRTRSVRSRARSIGANLRRRTDEKLAEVHRINRELVRIARRSVREARAVLRNARRKVAARGSSDGSPTG